MSAFSFNARYALLTYAQSGDLDPFEVSNHFSELGAECIVAREDHADGGTHLHTFVDFGRKYRTRRVDTFDVGGYHPNISPTYSTPQAGFDYAVKDGDVVAGGLERPNGSKLPTAGNKWSEIILAESREKFFQLVAAHDPRTLCTNFTSLNKYAEWKYRVDPKPYQHNPELHFSLDRFPELDCWAQEFIGQSGDVGMSCPSLTRCDSLGLVSGGSSPEGPLQPLSPLARGRW